MNEEYTKLLNLNWKEEEKEIIKRMFDNIQYYKSFTSKTSKNEIIKVINIIIELKLKSIKCECDN